jgi:hypothetical protein
MYSTSFENSDGWLLVLKIQGCVITFRVYNALLKSTISIHKYVSLAYAPEFFHHNISFQSWHFQQSLIINESALDDIK